MPRKTNNMSKQNSLQRTNLAISSDQFFLQNIKKFDVVLIDGLHTEEQVIKEVINGLNVLRKGGTIVLHDCNPSTEHMQRNIPKDDHNGPWTGTVWKAFAYFRMTRSDLAMATVDCDYGVGLIRRGFQKLYETNEEISYALFERDKKNMLNLIAPGELNDWLTKNGG